MRPKKKSKEHKCKWVVFQLNLPESYVIQKQVLNPKYKESEVTANVVFTGSTLDTGLSFTSGVFDHSVFGSEQFFGEQKYKLISLPTMVLVCICGKWKRLIAEEAYDVSNTKKQLDKILKQKEETT